MTRGAAGVAMGLLALACRADRPDAEVTRGGDSPARSSLSLPQHPDTLAKVLAVAVDSLRAAGEERYGRQEYDSARAIWQVELRRAQGAADSTAEARARMWLGLAAWRLGDYANARREGEAALRLKRRVGLDAELSRSFNALGLLAWNEGKHREALAHFDSAAASARRNEDEAGLARATGNIALVQVELGRFDDARRALDSAFAAGVRVGDERTQANALTNMAMLDVRLGNYARALQLLDRSRQRYAAMQYATGEANALGQQATAWLGLGELQRALASADSMLAIARDKGLAQTVAAALEIIADVHARAGNHRLALRQLAEADSIDAALGLAVEQGINLRRTAAILEEMGDAETSTAAARRALAVHRAAEAHAETVYDLLQLAQARRAAKDLRGARAFADSAATMAADHGNDAALREVVAVRAGVALDAKDPKGALALLRDLPRRDLVTDWPLNDLRAEAWIALERLDEARADAERAVEQLERQRGSLGEGPLRAMYLRRRTAPYARLIAIHLARRDTVAAFRAAAAVPGRRLAERLGGIMDGDSAARSTDPGEEALRRIAALEEQLGALDGRNDGEQRREIQVALQAARSEYEDALSRRARSPESAVAQRTVDVAGLRRSLETDEALLLTFAGPRELHTFLVRSSGVTARRSMIDDEALTARVRVARELLSRQRRQEAEKVLADLRDIVIPAGIDSALAGIRRLVVVPHGALTVLPFAALRDARSGAFLVERHAVSYLPSVSGWLVDSSRRRTSTTVAVFAPLSDSLPGTRREAAAVARIVGNARLHVGQRSSERGVRQMLESGAAVHLASHGAYDPRSPLFSRMIAGRAGRGGPGATDGRLEIHEILRMRIASDLVFLSGCETGLGGSGQPTLQSASDESSLAHAFLLAGARTVVATLWRVGDSTAVGMAESFYTHLAQGRPADEALAAGQREAIKRGHSMTWAAYAVFERNARKSAASLRITEHAR